MVYVKICGLTTTEDIETVNKHQPDFAGFVMFYPKSKRNISVENAKLLLNNLNSNIKSVAVVVSPTLEQIEIIQQLGFNIIQIHGKVNTDLLNNCKIPILKAFNVNDIDSVNYFNKCNKVLGFVFDAVEPGSGKTFDWNIINEIKSTTDKKIFLAGGLSSLNVTQAINTVNPYAVDVSSGVENLDGACKDAEKVKDFINKVLNCND